MFALSAAAAICRRRRCCSVWASAAHGCIGTAGRDGERNDAERWSRRWRERVRTCAWRLMTTAIRGACERAELRARYPLGMARDVDRNCGCRREVKDK
jgi:hypothetical protein